MTDTPASKRNRGRPRLALDQGKRVPLNMRTTREMRDRLEAAAEKSGRSLAQEVEFRLETSFFVDDAVPRRGAALAMILGLTERMTGESIIDDHETRELAKANVSSAVDGLAGIDPVYFSTSNGEQTAIIEILPGGRMEGDGRIVLSFDVLLDLLNGAGRR